MTTPDGAGWGGAAALSAWESLMWRADGGDPRTRSTGVLLEVLGETPDWYRLRRHIAGSCAHIPRLRSRIVEPPLPLVTPRWVPDTDFDLDYHLLHVRLPGEGDDAELLAQVDAQMSTLLDRHRPPWRMTLIEGLRDERAALALQVHHCLSDGQGLIQLMDLLHAPGRDGPDADPADAARDGADGACGPFGVLATGLREAAVAAPGDALDAAGQAWQAVRAGVGRPLGSARRVRDYASSLGRMVTPPAAERSPFLEHSPRGYATLVHDLALADLKAAAKAVGASVNDAFLAGVLGTFRRHHERLGGGVPDRMPLAFPISTRTADDPDGGNRFAGVRFAAPLAEPDPRARIAEIHAFARAARAEPALDFLDVLAPAIALLPGPALTELSATLTATTDVQASNFPGPSEPLWLAGAPVTGLYPLGPRPGITAMITMLSYAGTCCLGLTLDPRAVPDTAAFSACLAAGFGEVLALGAA